MLVSPCGGILAYSFNNYLMVAIPPIAFTIVNIFSYKYEIFKSIELKGRLGTIMYPLELVFTFPFFWWRGDKIPTLRDYYNGLGDGFAALYGANYEKYRYKILADKTIEGSLFMFIGSLISLIIVSILYYEKITSGILFMMFILSIIATIVEAVSPKNYNNLILPIVCALLFWDYSFNLPEKSLLIYEQYLFTPSSKGAVGF